MDIKKRNNYAALGDYHYEVEYDPSKVELVDDGVCESTIVRLFTKYGEKLIQYYGYGYCTDDGSDTPYRFLEYRWFVAPLAEALSFVDPERNDVPYNKGLYAFEADQGEFYLQMMEDCTERRMLEIYSTYDGGKTPQIISFRDVTINTPDGMYILDK